jgi:GGDEF domain-containing protein
MQTWAAAFWGAYFGTVALVLGGSLLAFIESHHRVALAAATAALISALFVVGYLGWLPITDPAAEDRVLAHIAIISAAVLGLLLWAMLGLLRPAATARRIRQRMLMLALGAMAASWLVDAWSALVLGSAVAFCMGLAALFVGLRSARRGDRLAWVGVPGIAFMMVSLVGLSWIAMDRSEVPLALHIVSAVSATAYLVTMAVMIWQRYSYLIELREVLVQGPSYDPITRMRSNAETGNMVGLAFFHQQQDPTRPVGVIAVSIGNLFALENLHGRAAMNHALFVCASRLRRCVPADVEMGRLGEDGFLLVARNATDLERLVQLGRVVAQRLARPVALSTSTAPAEVEASKAQWAAQVGVGLMATTARSRPSAVVAMARDMSRTAWSFSSRVAWHDQASGQIAELPASEAA